MNCKIKKENTKEQYIVKYYFNNDSKINVEEVLKRCFMQSLQVIKK